MRKVVLLSVCLLGCSRGNPEEVAVSAPPPPSAAVLAPGTGATLDARLAQLENELNSAIAHPNDDFSNKLIRAEAITDRLLETKLPFAWIRTSSYGVEPMVRQIQALADRVLAEMRSGMPTDSVMPDVRMLQDRVKRLRAGLRTAGSAAPPSLDQLLAAYAADTLATTGDHGE
jgi:hypothetical protein